MFGYVAITALAVPAALSGGVPAIAIIVAFTAVFVAVLFTQPVWTRVDRDGMTRRCPLRTQHIDWAEIDAFDRLRRSGGMVARLASGRHVVVCDRMEGHGEHHTLQEVVDRYQEAVAVPAAPELDQRPTSLYRRPEGGAGPGAR